MPAANASRDGRGKRRRAEEEDAGRRGSPLPPRLSRDNRGGRKGAGENALTADAEAWPSLSPSPPSRKSARRRARGGEERRRDADRDRGRDRDRDGNRDREDARSGRDKKRTEWRKRDARDDRVRSVSRLLRMRWESEGLRMWCGWWAVGVGGGRGRAGGESE